MSVVWRDSPVNEARYVRSGSAANAASPSSTATAARAAGATDGDPPVDGASGPGVAAGDMLAVASRRPSDGSGPSATGWQAAPTRAAATISAASDVRAAA